MVSKDKIKVSVIIPVYNAEKYLYEALYSLEIQTLKNFEVVLVNDGSTDESLNIMNEFVARDSRFRIINQKNTGIVGALNNGIKNSRGKYIARMDADDISMPRRLELQFDAMENDSNIVLCTGVTEVIDENSEFKYHELPLPDDVDLKDSMLLYNPIVHGSVMLRLPRSGDLYSNEFGPTEDYELWSRLFRDGKYKAIESVVYRWRINSAGISANSKKIQNDWAKKISEELWNKRTPKSYKIFNIRKKANTYFNEYNVFGLAYKNKFLTNQIRIGVRQIKRGSYTEGFKKIIGTILVGRSGVRIFYNYSRDVINGLISSRS